MQVLTSLDYKIRIAQSTDPDLLGWWKSTLESGKYTKVMVLADEHTVRYCMPILERMIGGFPDALYVIPAGEQHKELETAQSIWEFLLQAGADRHSLLINLGGGVIGDMGGFCAATYMRGIDFIQVPTTLLSMVDASVGGKLAIDFKRFKNLIGVFRNPGQVIICPDFLNTLPHRIWESGLAEMVKHALIADISAWENLVTIGHVREVSMETWEKLICQSVMIKRDIVEEDPKEQGRRAILNFGHSIGHALEAVLLKTRVNLLHGEAVAWGMVAEAWISHEVTGLPLSWVDAIGRWVSRLYPELPTDIPREEWLGYLRSDKKNRAGVIRMVLLEKAGMATWNHEVPESLCLKALDYLHTLTFD